MNSTVKKIGLSAMIALALTLTPASGALAQTPGKNTIVIRGQRQEIYVYPARGAKLNRKVLFVPGDGGWRGWAVTVAQQMSGWGYDVYGLDTKTYLSGFTGGAGIKETDVNGDFRRIAEWASGGANGRMTLVGWSEGAGLCVLAAAGPDNKRIFNGLVTFGLGDENVLGWSWKDDLTYLTKAKPNEPTFHANEYMAKIAPLPYLMIHSSRDEYVPFEEAKRLATAAREPKRVSVIQANNHRFEGNTAEFYRTLQEGLQWMS